MGSLYECSVGLLNQAQANSTLINYSVLLLKNNNFENEGNNVKGIIAISNNITK